MADVGHVGNDFIAVELAIVDMLGVRKLGEILDVQQGKAAGIFGEPLQGIGTADVGPAEVHFHAHITRVGVLNQNVVGQCAVGTGNKLHPVAVIGESDAFLVGDLAGFV